MGEAFICRRGGGSNKRQIVVTAPTGSSVTATMGDVTKTAVEKAGKWLFKNCSFGTWTIQATKGGLSAAATVNILESDNKVQYDVLLDYRLTPAFTYSGSCQVVNDSDAVISDFANYKGNWKIRFLTGGTLKFTDLYGFNGKIDAFLVGGGAAPGPYWSGGGSGKTNTKRAAVQANTNYTITIGVNGGTTSAFGISAAGGTSGRRINCTLTKSNCECDSGGSGGSGGGAGGTNTVNWNSWGAPGGTNGGNGSDGNSGCSVFGIGQGTSTREFYGIDKNNNAKLYAAGGNGRDYSSKSTVVANSGNGASAGVDSAGSSGIVIIRNSR